MPNAPRSFRYGDALYRKRTAPRLGSTARLYDARWQRASKAHLVAHPLCERCRSRGWTSQAKVVDHIKPHRGDLDLFWDEDNWQSLCKRCHDIKTATEDRRRTPQGGRDRSSPKTPDRHHTGFVRASKIKRSGGKPPRDTPIGGIV